MGWLAALFMGLVLGMLGGGGGILAVPILIGFFGFGGVQATGGSLFVVGITSLAGAIEGLLKREARLREALSLALPSMVGAVVARALLVPHLPPRIVGFSKDDVLLLAFASLMIVVGARFLAKLEPRPIEVQPAWWKVPLFGLGIGLVSGTLGAGGGFLIVPVLTLMVGLDLATAVPTSLVVIAIQSLGGVVPELWNPTDWGVLASVTGVALVGMLVGTRLRRRIPQDGLRLGFGILVLAVAAFLASRVVLNRS